ncbi:hypothetical protein J3458_020951 [Metarhizium acridum]|uniref:uncharacterized protein n=1 Tax=Metarhizium acridum TaxID=92637 RepID=UPI001C6AC2C3|nr:hypothetical protein J3458_020951 [Metarhizium acridum]
MSDMNLSDDSPLSELSKHSPISGDGAKVYQAIEDEAIVNTALVLFLNALTLHCEDSLGQWTLRRHPFIVRSANTNEKIYEVRVDGLLRLNKSQHPAAIMEVKSFLRYGDDGSSGPIRMQESAQMAAWIAENPPPSKSNSQKHRRLLVSQDRHEIYLNIATFSDDYVDYIRVENLKINDNAFLTMQEYGPFTVDKVHRMNQVAKILLGVSIQGGLK